MNKLEEFLNEVIVGTDVVYQGTDFTFSGAEVTVDKRFDTTAIIFPETFDPITWKNLMFVLTTSSIEINGAVLRAQLAPRDESESESIEFIFTLKPTLSGCPFCSGEPDVDLFWDCNDFYYRIVGHEEGCYLHDEEIYYDDLDLLVDTWEKRNHAR